VHPRPVDGTPRAARGTVGSALALLALATLGGCSAPTLDASDLEASARRVRASVDAERRIAFDEALQAVQQASRGEVAGTKAFPLDGMTADAIFGEAERIGIRRDIAWFEELRRYHEGILGTLESLALFRVVDATPIGRGDDRVRLLVTVRNGLDGPVGAGWLTTEIQRGDGKTVSSLDYLVFRPPLGPGATARAQFVVSGDAARFLPEAAATRVSYRFSSVERGGRAVLEAPTPEMAAKARAGVEETEARIAELEKRLAGVS
jgi:hypothetical protein